MAQWIESVEFRIRQDPTNLSSGKPALLTNPAIHSYSIWYECRALYIHTYGRIITSVSRPLICGEEDIEYIHTVIMRKPQYGESFWEGSEARGGVSWSRECAQSHMACCHGDGNGNWTEFICLTNWLIAPRYQSHIGPPAWPWPPHVVTFASLYKRLE